MTGQQRDTLRTVAGLVCVFCLITALLVIAVQSMAGPPTSTDMLTVDRNGYLHGVRYVDRLVDTPTAGGWPRDQLGLEAACRSYLDERPRGFDRAGFLAGCRDAAVLTR